MTYSTVGAVRRALAPSLSNPDVQPDPKTNTAADVDNATITDAIAEADSRIDSYISGRYLTPVADVSGSAPAPILYWSRDLAAYLTYLVWRKSQDVTPNEPIRLRAEQTVAEMTAVRDGKSTLSLPVNDTGTGQSGGALPAMNLGYSGTMFDPSQFDLYGPDWLSPRWGGVFDGRWHDSGVW